MLKLVEYDSSEDESVEAESNQIEKSLVLVKETDENNSQRDNTPNANIENGKSALFASLPLSKSSECHAPQVEDRLDDLVKRKDWEVKLSLKKKKKKHIGQERSRKKEKNRRADGKIPAKRRHVVINAFEGLKILTEDEQNDSVVKRDNMKGSSSSAGLLSLLPQPKNAVTDRKSSSFVIQSRPIIGKNSSVEMRSTTTYNARAGPANMQSPDDDCSDPGNLDGDYFGLKKRNEVPTEVLALSNKKFGPSKPFDVEAKPLCSFSNGEKSVQSYDEINNATSEVIDDNDALRLIYAQDVFHFGGKVSDAAEAVEQMVDVKVDQALGPNIQANLLKNLHNKSLSEAAIAHLASVPKIKTHSDMVARRKHQITYLADVAVAREEQLAEQWSQSRHNKRVSAQKYGF